MSYNIQFACSFIAICVSFTDATMSCLPRIYLSVAAILVLLAILLSASQSEGYSGESSGYLEEIPEEYDYCGIIQRSMVCKSKLERRIVRVHSRCRVDLSSRRCIAYCDTGIDRTMYYGNGTYIIQGNLCSCCKPSCCKPSGNIMSEKKRTNAISSKDCVK